MYLDMLLTLNIHYQLAGIRRAKLTATLTTNTHGYQKFLYATIALGFMVGV